MFSIYRRLALMATDNGRPLYESFGFEDVPEMSALLEPSDGEAS